MDLIKHTKMKLKLIGYLLNVSSNKLNTLSSVHSLPRQKGGLFNPLGSIVKAITGNLDQEDAERYDAATSKL